MQRFRIPDSEGYCIYFVNIVEKVVTNNTYIYICMYSTYQYMCAAGFASVFSICGATGQIGLKKMSNTILMFILQQLTL